MVRLRLRRPVCIAIASFAAATASALSGCAQCASTEWAQNTPTISPSEPGVSPVDLGPRDEGPITHLPESALLGDRG